MKPNLRILELLSRSFGNISAAATEIINLEAILNLPKGTEHFVADIHGEDEAFTHILKNASGNIKRKVREIFGQTMREEDIRNLCTLIYYPEQKLAMIRKEEKHLDNFYSVTLHHLVKVLQNVSSKYTRSKVRKSLPKEFAYVIEELLHEAPSSNKYAYYNCIVQKIITTGQADSFIIAIANVIQRLSIDQLHILGDIYDRGPGAHLILDTLSRYNGFDIQWGNHDALWMGAAAGNLCCMANVLRICLRYANMSTLEDGYGINLLPLATFAWEMYRDDPCEAFVPKLRPEEEALTEKNRRLIAQMHKAIFVIQMKLEAAMIDRHPEWGMADRKQMHLIDFENKKIEIEGRTFEMPDTFFPTVDPEDPYRLTPEEQELVDKLAHSFASSDKLRRHIDLLFSHGALYTVCNSNLLFHAAVPLNEDGSMKDVEVYGKKYKGVELMTKVGQIMRAAFNTDADEDMRAYARDYYLYLWCGPDSPLFDKRKMATFERYFFTDKQVRHEEKGWYYKLRDNEQVVDSIMDAFGVTGTHRHIINGHVPVKVGEGESPIRANGKLMVIDGGFSKAYHTTTGIAGYTLVYHSRGFELVQHEPFTSAEEAVRTGSDILGRKQVVEVTSQRTLVRDTDRGRELQVQIDELTRLLHAYRLGIIKEKK